MRITIGIAVVLVAACGEPRVGDDVVGKLVANETIVRASFENRDERRDETVEGTCRAWTVSLERGGPAGLSAGPIRVEGLRDAITLEYGSAGEGYIYQSSVNLYYPAWNVLASAPGDEVDGFALTVGALEQFVEDNALLSLPGFTGTPVTVTWAPAVQADPDAVVELAGYAGGGHAGTISRFFECLGTDTGSITVGPVISAELAAFGGWGYAELSRFHEVVHSAPGYEVRFRIATSRTFMFDG